MTTYTFIPNPPNPEKVNQVLNTSKVIGISWNVSFEKIILETSSNFTAQELTLIRNALDKIFLFGYTEEVA